MKRLFIALLIILGCILQGQAPAPPQQPKTITLTLSVQDTETVLEALGKLPYEKVAPVVQSIWTQAQKQLNTQNLPDSTKQKNK